MNQFKTKKQHIVFAITGLIAYAIPDVPSSVRDKQIRERLLEREVLLLGLPLHQDQLFSTPDDDNNNNNTIDVINNTATNI